MPAKDQLASLRICLSDGASRSNWLAHDIQVHAAYIAQQLTEMHGGSWRFVIDHSSGSGFVLVRPDN